MSWKLPPKVKLYEALGALGDGRISLVTASGNRHVLDATELPVHSDVFNENPAVFSVRSSNDDKAYEVRVQLQDTANSTRKYAIACNDNGSVFQGYLGYPALGVMIYYGILPCAEGREEALRGAVKALCGIKWKDLALKHRNKWDMVVADALAQLDSTAREVVVSVVDSLFSHLEGVVLRRCCRMKVAAKSTKRDRE